MKECKGEYRETPETTVTVKLWAIIGLVTATLTVVIGGLYAGGVDRQKAINLNSERITRLEVYIPTINDRLSVMQDDLSKIREYQRSERHSK